MRQIREVLRLKWVAGLTHRAVARACGTGIGTVTGYLQRATAAGLTWQDVEQLDDGTLEARVFGGGTGGAPAEPRAEPDLARVHEELQRPGVTLVLLWQEYREAHPEGLGYSRFCERYAGWRRRLRPSMRQQHRAGEKTFFDFSGKRPEIVDRATGEVTTVELFVAVLGASSYTYAEATASQGLHSWLSAHDRACAFFGGATEIWVPDNLKSGVTRACRYEPTVQRSYAELAEHHGAVVVPARARKPKDKAKVEVAVQVVQRWILARLRNRTFFSLAELNAAIRELLVELNERPMRHAGCSRRELFERLDRPALRPLPGTSWEMREWKECTVSLDYHVEVERNYYSVPYQLAQQKVEARWTRTAVEVFHGGRRVTSHERLSGRGRHATKVEHMPRSHRAHAEWTPTRIVRWAESKGPAVAEFVERVLRERPHPEMGYRSCLGIIRLGDRHGDVRLERACRRALVLRSHSYKTVKNILSSGTDQLELPVGDEPRPRLSPHENVRGGAYYSTESTC